MTKPPLNDESFTRSCIDDRMYREHTRDMNTTSTAVREILIKLDRNGKRRASFLSLRAGRMLPMPIADADLMIATGQAVRADRHPLTGEEV